MRTQTEIIPDGIAKIDDVFCGCGDPEAAWEEIKKELTRLNQEHMERKEIESSGLWYIMAYLIGHMELSEHGGGIGGAWLTPLGKETLDFLEKYGANWKENQEVEFQCKKDIWRSFYP